ncbi:G-protein coupled receptor GRL101-like protein [Trichoplax sp. H2]|nr:G-protein coupled receptor GRL101-like protein [Trichoplax sp. H2]|eukprot:RDD47648.1 G-protein coupled receptor GRL101-like protein [Trichoplax sp. H2]
MANAEDIAYYTRVLQNNNGVRIVTWMFGIIAIPSNLIIILWIAYNYCQNGLLHRYFRHRNSFNLNPSFAFLLFNLAVSDLLGGSYLLILAISDATYTISQNFSNISYLRIHPSVDTWIISPTCSVERFLAQTSLIISILITFVITLDRYLAVFYSASTRYRISVFQAQVTLAVFWTIGIILAILGAVDSYSISLKKPGHYSILGHLCQLEGSSTFIINALTYLDMTVGIGVNIVIAILYIAILIRLKRHRQSIQQRKSPIERHIQVITAWIIITSVVTWIPVIVWVIIQRAMTPVEFDDRENFLLPILVIMLYSNTALNPLIPVIIKILVTSRLHNLFTPRTDVTPSQSRDKMNVVVITTTIIPKVIASDSANV